MQAADDRIKFRVSGEMCEVLRACCLDRAGEDVQSVHVGQSYALGLDRVKGLE